MAKVAFKNIADTEVEFRDIDRDRLISVSYEYARTSDDELYNLIMKEKVTIQLNGEVIHPDDWLECEVSEEDEIIITPTLHGGGDGGWLKVIVISKKALEIIKM